MRNAHLQFFPECLSDPKSTVELASLNYYKSRLVRARGKSGARLGFGAGGESEVGKSSLVAALSRSDMYVDDKLFATLDTRSRRVILPSGRKVILTDTVGFISDLPIQLVEAFQATLKEVVDADYLLHVIDSSAPSASEQRETVLEVLQKIGVSRYKMENCLIEVWNKIDLSGEEFVISQTEDLPEGRVETTGGEYFSTEADGSDFAKDGSQTYAAKKDMNYEETQSYGTEPLDLEWVCESEAVPSVKISVRTKTGLLELSRLLDTKVQSDWIEEGSILAGHEH